MFSANTVERVISTSTCSDSMDSQTIFTILGWVQDVLKLSEDQTSDLLLLRYVYIVTKLVLDTKREQLIAEMRQPSADAIAEVAKVSRLATALSDNAAERRSLFHKVTWAVYCGVSVQHSMLHGYNKLTLSTQCDLASKMTSKHTAEVISLYGMCHAVCMCTLCSHTFVDHKYHCRSGLLHLLSDDFRRLACCVHCISCMHKLASLLYLPSSSVYDPRICFLAC